MKLYCIAILLLLLGCQQQKPPKETIRENEVQQLLSRMKASADIETEEGIALVLLVDASGSMDDFVRDPGGDSQKKIDVAKRAAKRVIANIREFQNKNPKKKIKVAVYNFHANSVTPLLPMTDALPAGTETLVENLSAFGNTPLGEAIASAKEAINKSHMKSGNIIVISDGENTEGPTPDEAMRAMSQLPYAERARVFLIAFDVQAKLFDTVKEEGALVLEAQNNSELQQTMDYILYKKILVEEPIVPQKESLR